MNAPEKEKLVKEKLSVILDAVGFNKDDITMGANLKDDMGMNSLDTLELCMSLENEFEISIEDDEWKNVQTVQNAVDCVLKCNPTLNYILG